ncbi:succinyl-diaminopimelate desuccinylase [Candidatus Vidania fulgoroideorum]
MNILKKILEKKSVTPNDNKIQKIIKIFLKKIGFEVFIFKKKNVTNSIFLYLNKRNKKIKIAFSGHTDVVSENRLKKWNFNPFKLNFYKGKIFARGICDMKGSIFCFLKSVKQIIKKKKMNIMIILTSDEEGIAKYGTNIIVKILIKKGFLIKNFIIGEPSSNKSICDVIKNGRRGSCNIKIKIKGKQGHSAYPKYAVNSIHRFILKLKKIFNIKLKYCDIQITLLKCENKTINIIPGLINFFINIRYDKKINFYKIYFLIIKILIKEKFSIKVINNNREFFKKSKNFCRIILNILNKMNIKSKIENKKGGTSDGRFIKNISKNVIEIGMKNYYAHKYDENVKLKEIFLLNIIYYNILKII